MKNVDIGKGGKNGKDICLKMNDTILIGLCCPNCNTKFEFPLQIISARAVSARNGVTIITKTARTKTTKSNALNGIDNI